VGARSAVFAPCRDIGLIIIDEEHDHSYKQDAAPRYHAREVALKRAALDGAVVVLGSATPSLESYHRATRGDYAHVKMTRRIAGRALPAVENCRHDGRSQDGSVAGSEYSIEGLRCAKRRRVASSRFCFSIGAALRFMCSAWAAATLSDAPTVT
jgi:primosomal protein N'